MGKDQTITIAAQFYFGEEKFMSPDLIDALWVILIVTIFSTILSPILCWLLARHTTYVV
ncbi:hypothetical protein [Spirulina subsalsa]|uniref:hypothetical protein n=1 Tax=Spirulina subsalsa TaxID=54311 RepID=UPI00031F9B2D|nr:hypothetical protein [Spirulina subsalsa]